MRGSQISEDPAKNPVSKRERETDDYFEVEAIHNINMESAQVDVEWAGGEFTIEPLEDMKQDAPLIIMNQLEVQLSSAITLNKREKKLKKKLRKSLRNTLTTERVKWHEERQRLKLEVILLKQKVFNFECAAEQQALMESVSSLHQ